MGNIKGFSGVFWFFTIILIPIKMKKYGILAILVLVLLCLLNFLSDIYEYRKEFIREKKSVILKRKIMPICLITINLSMG